MAVPDITTRNWLLHFLANHYFPRDICEKKEEGGDRISPIYIYIYISGISNRRRIEALPPVARCII